MPKGRTKFQDSWLEKELDGVLLKEWCSRSAAEDVSSARCILCKETFDISSSGFAQVRSHHKGKKHLFKFNSRFKNMSIISSFHKKNIEATATPSNKNEDLSYEMKIIKAETRWALRVAESNMSFKSCSENIEIFRDMFTDSSIATNLKMKEKKVAYVITHGISTYFELELKRDIEKCSSGITIEFDESTTAQVKKQLDLHARFWSEENNMVVCRYLTSVFLGHAFADTLLKELLNSLASFNISLKQIVCLSRDNPNVNKSLFKKFNDVILKETGINLSSLGVCNLHVANNAFKMLINSLEKEFNFDEFATDVHYYLKHSAARREDFLSMEDITNVTARFLLRHVSSRWLTAGPVAQRLIDQWANMKEYFQKFLPSQKSFNASDQYIRINNCLKNPLTPCFLAYIVYTHKFFERFSLCFQTEAPMIHVLYSEINKLIRNLMMQFINEDEIGSKEGNELKIIEVNDTKILKKTCHIEVGVAAKKILQTMKDNEKKTFYMCIRPALISTVKYMKCNFPYCNEFLKCLQVFQPLSLEVNSIIDGLNDVTKVATYLKFSDDVINNIRDEWKLLKCDNSAQEKLAAKNLQCRIDLYWREIFNLTDIQGNYKYSNLMKLIKSSLVLPHGNSDPERGFSANKAMLKANHSENTVKSLRLVKDVVRSYGSVLGVPITLNLLNAVKNSHKPYQEYLDKQKEEEEKLQKEKEKREREASEKEKSKKRKHDLDQKIDGNSDVILKLKEEKEVAIGLITEGTARLSKAITEKNNVGLNVAQKLITEATDQLKEIELKLSNLEDERDVLLKKRMKF